MGNAEPEVQRGSDLYKMNQDAEQVARQAVAEVGPRIRAAWSRAKTVMYKGAVDLVTETDREVKE